MMLLRQTSVRWAQRARLKTAMANEPNLIPRVETAEPANPAAANAVPDGAKPDQVKSEQARPDQAASDQAKSDQARSDQARPDARGTVLGGRYVLREPLGEGGMAVVWRAFDSHLKRDVALKLLHEHVLPVDRERFGREIRTLARLSHPGVVTIFDLGGEGNRTFFTMELLEGGPISNLGPVEDTPDDLERFLQVSISAARALMHIHSQGMVHRDLTPRNILLDANASPRIMDFGLVYVRDATRDLTRTGYTAGTPQYMAPEQARGGLVASASDVYAFGAVLFRTLSGRAPFEADNDQGILYQHVYEKAPSLEQLNPAIPSEISETIAEFLEKKSSDRPTDPGLTLEAALEDVRRLHIPGQHRGGRARAGVYPHGPARPRKLELVWEAQLPGEVAWPAAITANRDVLAIGTRSGSLCLLEIGSGIRYADLPAGDEVTAPATFDGNTVAYAAWDGLVRLVDWRTGVTRWTHKTRSEITAAPTRWADHWLIASRDGHLHALSANGKLEWAYRAGSPIAGSPTLWGGLCFIADEEGWIHALEPRAGKLAWKVRLGSVHASLAIGRHPRIPGNAVLIAPTWTGEVHAIHLTPGEHGLRPHDEPLWTYDLEGEIWSSAALLGSLGSSSTDASTSDAGSSVILGSWSNAIVSLNLETGDDRWNLKLQDRVTGSPIISKGTVYVTSEAGEIVAVRAKDGLELWRDSIDASIQGTPLAVDGRLIVASLDGRIRSYR
jgi:eukaryotic-like serine/threonine-protein kinase